MNWISAAELALIHERVVSETQGLQGISNPGAVESSLARPFSAFGGVELFPDLIAKVAALIHVHIPPATWPAVNAASCNWSDVQGGASGSRRSPKSFIS